jgi:putative glycosyltransferase (TIGR04348 family)
VRALSICIVSTTPSHSKKGNRVTAVRWSRLLRALGHRVRIEEQYKGGSCDVLIAMHARRSRPSVERFTRKYPDRPLILALTGTDLYRDIHSSAAAKRALAEAARLVLLQPLGIAEIPKRFRGGAWVILQSAQRPAVKPKPRTSAFEVCVLGHLRTVKDPFRTAKAARLLPMSSRIRVLHIGGALSPGMKARALSEERTNRRYRWMGELTRGRALRLMGRCRLLVLSSWMEGGANAISEALAWGVPVIASHIPGSVGLLGFDYPGYFRPGDTRGLAKLLSRAETDRRFYRRLQAHCAKLAPRVRPSRERQAWARLLRGLPSRRKAE